MKFLLLTGIFWCSFFAKAQEMNSYAYVDSKALQIPKAATYSTASISEYIQANFKTDIEKARAAYAWITSNIQYSKDSMFYRYWGDEPEKKLSSVLRNRKGVCGDYAGLFTNILLKCNIPSFIITGITRTGSSVNRAGHCWNAVQVGNEWFLCDPTWDQGYAHDTRYFMKVPPDFIDTHFPFDPLWQLSEHPITHKEFRYGYSNKKNDPVFHYSDSVAAFLKLDTLQQQEAASERMKRSGLDDETLQTWYAYNQMKITITYQENDMTLFNSAVSDLNKAKRSYNDFVQFRNNLFTPPKTDAALNDMFYQIDSLILSAERKAKHIGVKTENYQYDTDGLKMNLDALTEKTKEQKQFLREYFATSLADRQKLFYH